MEQKTLPSVDSGHFSLRRKHSTTIENFSPKSSLPPVYSMQFTLRTLFSKKIKRRLLRLIVDTSYLDRNIPRLSQTFHSSVFTVRILRGSTFLRWHSQTIKDLGPKVTHLKSQVPVDTSNNMLKQNQRCSSQLIVDALHTSTTLRTLSSKKSK